MPLTIFWHRRDLRLHDNAGAYHALRGEHPVLPIFIFDRHILDKLEDRDDARVQFLRDTLTDLQSQLREMGSELRVYYGYPEEIWPQILAEYDVAAVYINRDYESYARERDAAVAELLAGQHIPFKDYKDHVIFDGDEVVKKDGGPYTVFTPYKRTWLAQLQTDTRTVTNERGEQETISCFLQSYPNEKHFGNYWRTEARYLLPSLAEMGFEPSSIPIPSATVARGLIKNYDETRDIPSIEGTSRLGIHFRHGTISIREKARRAARLNETYLSELVWRDFYSSILQHFPHVERRSFRPEYEEIPWRNDEVEFAAWCAGKTGFPIVDAGMRELNATGFMHNRVRMIVASFLTKHLLIDWRWGEAYFARRLLDFELASNNGGWQWAAGCGTDAQPYFRVFNPYSQQKKFDPKFVYIKRWVPEYGTDAYPEPIVEHKTGRERALRVYKEALAAARAQG
jgi:deoxyribodipyrimidine photo-lyase